MSEHNKSGRTYQETAELYEKKLQESIKVLRDMKFRFILGKTLKFSNQRDSKVENVRAYLPLRTAVGNKSQVSVSWKMEKTTVEV